MLKIKLLCILETKQDSGFEEQAEECSAGGADALLLYGDSLTPKESILVGLKIREIARKNKVLFLINGRPDIALAVDADGVHLRPDDVSIDLAKQIVGPRKIIGFAASSLSQAVAAAQEGAGYIMAGPMFSKELTSPGIDMIRLIKKRIKVPVIAFGEINSENITETMQAGADGIAVSCEAFKAQAAGKLKERILELGTKEDLSRANSQ